MKPPQAPPIEKRRKAEFAAELRRRAHAWVPRWGSAGDDNDFADALLEIAARFNSEVAERLDNTAEKMRRGLLDWLGIRGEAARPARVPVVFTMANTASEAVFAQAPIQMQADANGTSIVFETERDIRIVPGRLTVIVGADPGADAFYLPPPGLSDLEPLAPLPTRWQLKSFAAEGSKTLQLDPEAGLTAGTIIETAGQHYRVSAAPSGGIVSVEPALATDLPEASSFSKVITFAPFGGAARNQQEHALYLGDADLLNLEAEATIDVVGGAGLLVSYAWEYWGKTEGGADPAWQPLAIDPNQTAPDAVRLKKPKGSVELKEIAQHKSRWIRAVTTTVPAADAPFRADELSIRVNAAECNNDVPCPPKDQTSTPAADAFANTAPLVLENLFYPLGKEPRQFDSFYLGSTEAFQNPGRRWTCVLMWRIEHLLRFLWCLALRSLQVSVRIARCIC